MFPQCAVWILPLSAVCHGRCFGTWWGRLVLLVQKLISEVSVDFANELKVSLDVNNAFRDVNVELRIQRLLLE